MRNTRSFRLLSVSLTAFALWLPAAAQTQENAATPTQPAVATSRVAAGQKQKISGIIVSREADSMVVRDSAGADVAVRLTSYTKMTERKGNPFRKAKAYPVTALLRGLKSRSKRAVMMRANWSPRRSNSPTTISAWRVLSIRASPPSNRV
jgi:hypothetical protein